MNTSEQINEIAAALAKAQATIKNPAKDKVNPHFKSNYADLASGLDVIRPALSANGIAVVQPTEIVGNNIVLVTRLVHSSGQWIEGLYPVCAISKHQEMGAAMTYAKRQSLFAIVGVCGDDDDDGNEANKVAPAAVPATHQKRELPKITKLSEQDSALLRDTMLASLEFGETREALLAWVTANSASKAKLTDSDKLIVESAFNEKQASLKKPRHEPIHEAAE